MKKLLAVLIASLFAAGAAVTADSRNEEKKKKATAKSLAADSTKVEKKAAAKSVAADVGREEKKARAKAAAPDAARNEEKKTPAKGDTKTEAKREAAPAAKKARDQRQRQKVIEFGFRHHAPEFLDEFPGPLPDGQRLGADRRGITDDDE